MLCIFHEMGKSIICELRTEVGVLIQEPGDKERRFCKKQGLELIAADVFDQIGTEALA